jgi:hypothetical protein
MMVLRYEGYSFDNDGLLRYNTIIYVPPNDNLRIYILNEVHRPIYMAHLRVTKMKVGLKRSFFWK